jgi:hypothetical protein
MAITYLKRFDIRKEGILAIEAWDGLFAFHALFALCGRAIAMGGVKPVERGCSGASHHKSTLLAQD